MTGNPRKRANIMLIGQKAGEQGRALKYDPEFCWTVRQMGQAGQFPEEWCARIGITMGTLFNWANTYPDFDQAVREAWHLLNAYWTAKARQVVENPLLYSDLKATVFLEILRKRFPETWGKHPRNTQETFETRNASMEGTASPLTDPNRLRDAKIDELEQRLRTLRARREAEEPKKDGPPDDDAAR